MIKWLVTLICKGGKNILRDVNQSGKIARQVSVIDKIFPINKKKQFDHDNAGYHRKKQAKPYLCNKTFNEG